MSKKTRGIHAACIYPGISAWLRSRHMSLMALSKTLGIAYCHIYRIVNGRISPTKRYIDKILQVTGMTYEEAFGDPRKESESA